MAERILPTAGLPAVRLPTSCRSRRSTTRTLPLYGLNGHQLDSHIALNESGITGGVAVLVCGLRDSNSSAFPVQIAGKTKNLNYSNKEESNKMWRKEAVRRGLTWSRGPASALQHGSLAGRGAAGSRSRQVFPLTRHLGLPHGIPGPQHDAPKMTVPSMLRTRAGMEGALPWTRTRATSRSSVLFGRPQLRAYAASSRKTDPLVAAVQGRKSARQPKARKGAAWWKSSEQDFNKGTKVHSADSIEIAVRDQNVKLLEKIATQNADIVQRRDNLLMVPFYLIFIHNKQFIYL